MALYTRILVTLDGTSVDDPLLEHVRELAAIHQATVVLLRVAHYHTRDMRTHEEEESREYLAEAAARFGGHGFAVETVLGRGEPADEILRQAVDQRADLIALATHGHGWLPRMVLGSVVDKVRHATAIPVLLIRGGHDGAAAASGAGSEGAGAATGAGPEGGPAGGEPRDAPPSGPPSDD
jgi:nucleotide-binding universal stress UspA family protein